MKKLALSVLLPVFFFLVLTGCGALPLSNSALPLSNSALPDQNSAESDAAAISSPGAVETAGNTAALSTEPDAATDTGDPASQFKANISFEFAKETLELKPMESSKVSEQIFREDASGSMHRFFSRYGGQTVYHSFQDASGNWSAPVKIIETCSTYSTLPASDGSLCVAWTELGESVLHSAYFRGGGFQEAPVTDYTQGGNKANIDSINALYFDIQGKLQCLYFSNAEQGYFLSGHQLTKREETADGLKDTPIVDSLCGLDGFVADGKGVLHAFQKVDNTGTGKSDLMHSYSEDSGVTWHGPDTLLKDSPNFTAAYSDDTEGNLYLLVSLVLGGQPDPRLVLYMLKANDSYRPQQGQTLLTNADILGVVYEKGYDNDKADFGFCKFVSMQMGSGGTAHFIGSSKYFYAVSVNNDGLWNIRQLHAPNVELDTTLFRRNGNLFVAGSTTEVDKTYYSGEISF